MGWTARDPLIFLADNDGGRLPDVLGWRFSKVAFDFSTFLAVRPGCPDIPRTTAVLGASFGDSSLHSAMSHFVVLKRDAAIALSGPPVVRGAIGEDVTTDELGGPEVAAEVNGTAHMVVDDEPQALEAIRRFLSYLPDSAALPAPTAARADPSRDPEELIRLVPVEREEATTCEGFWRRSSTVARCFTGRSASAEVSSAPSRVSRDRRSGHRVAAIAPSRRDGRARAQEGGEVRRRLRDVQPADAVFQDVPGLMIGAGAEKAGILASYEEVVTRLARAKVPKIAIIVRKAYGGGHIALGGRPVKPDLLFAWPTAELGFMAPETGVRTAYRRRLEHTLEEEGQKAHDDLAAELEAEWASESEPWEAARNLLLDDVIDPRSTRELIRAGLEFGWGSSPRVTQTGC